MLICSKSTSERLTHTSSTAVKEQKNPSGQEIQPANNHFNQVCVSYNCAGVLRGDAEKLRLTTAKNNKASVWTFTVLKEK